MNLLLALLLVLPQANDCPRCGTETVARAKYCHECGVDLRIEQGPSTVVLPDLGVRLPLPRGKFKFRTKEFTLGWGGTQCEIEGLEGRAFGVITHWVWGATPKAFADWREGNWKTVQGVTNVRRGRDQVLRKPYGEWLRTEIQFDYNGTGYHYLETFVRRGSRNVELVLWSTEADWVDVSKTLQGIADAFEYQRVVRCPSCRLDLSIEDRTCRGCQASLAAPDADLDRLSRQYGIQVIADVSRHYPLKTASGHKVHGHPAPAKEVGDFCRLLAKELAKYPEELLRKLQLERFVLCRAMERDDVRYGGLSEYDSDTIHFEITEGWNIEHFMVSKIHHELYHFIDYRDDLTTEKDDAWEKLNTRGFAYDPKKKAYGGLDDKDKGFLNSYAQTGVGEDKAEVFGYLVTCPKVVIARGEKDPVLAKKIARMKELAKSYCGALDDGFWQARALDR